jgi:anaerobic ribonucleoside-triphosphate reductase activating protein
MKYTKIDITFQEVPNEVSLVISIAGCPLRCKGCHSADTWNKNTGKILTEAVILDKLKQYKSLITCVCFLGGEWLDTELLNYLKLIKSNQLKTCLYTGLEKVNPRLLRELDYVKLGPWDENKGGLNQISTNQKFIKVKTMECLNHLFQN